MQDWTAIDAQVSAYLGRNFRTSSCQSLSGGCINSAWQIWDHYSVFFVKLNSTHYSEMFTAEYEGLQALRSSNSVKVPEPITYGSADQYAFLVTEYVPMDNRFSATRFGEQLAKMHYCCADQYGWHRDNTIGLTAQQNTPQNDWVDFWHKHRLGFQLRLAKSNGHNNQLQTLGLELLEKLPEFFLDYTPKPSLLHGDLWSGNISGYNNQAVIFDPATYYGDRETDIAMTELFGGLPTEFYDAYQANWLLDSGYGVRKNLYNLYHILNHLNLFGAGYYRQSVHLLRSLLAELR